VRTLVGLLALVLAPAVGAAQPASQPVVIDAPPRPELFVPFVAASGGVAYRSAFSENLVGGGVDVDVAAQNAAVMYGFRAAVEAGVTEYGLGFEALTFGPTYGWRFGPRWRLTIGGDLGALMIERATRSDRLWSILLGVHTGLAGDLARAPRRGALFAALQVGAEVLTDAMRLTPASLVVRGGVGYRIEAGGGG
jgi:hypothetical protein